MTHRVLAHHRRTIEFGVVDLSVRPPDCSRRRVVDDDVRATESTQARRDHGDLQFVLHVRIDHRTDHDRRLFGRELVDRFADVGELADRQIRTGSDVDQNSARAMQVDVFEQWAANRRLCRIARTVFAFCTTGAHHRHAHFRHHGSDVREVDVDHAGPDDEIGNALHRTQQHVVSCRECRQHARALTEHREQFLVRNRDQRIDEPRQLRNTRIGNVHPLFEAERFRHDGDRQNFEFPRNLRNDGSRTCSGSTAHAGGDEHHVGARKHFRDAIAILERGLATDLRIRPGTESLREGSADLQRGLRIEALQCLRIGVRRDEIHTLDAPTEHVLDGVAATTTDANHFDDRALRPAVDEFKHFLLLIPWDCSKSTLRNSR